MKSIAYAIAIVLSISLSLAQQTTKHIDGLRDKPLRYLAITNLTLVPEPGQVIEGATVIIRDNKIEAAGKGIAIPAGATVRDGKGLWCYAGFIEAYTNAGLASKAKAKEAASEDGEDDGSPVTPQVNVAKHWNLAVKPEERAVQNLVFDDKAAEEFRKLGFTALHTNSMDGIFRGSSALILAKGGTTHELTLQSDAMQWISFRKGSSKTPYPSSMMGSIALIRQAFMDADWYAKAHEAYTANPALQRPEVNISYEALADALKNKKTFVFETENEHSIMRAQKIAQEFGLNAIYEGNGYEYRRLKSLLPFKPFLILPLNFPAVPDVSSPDRAVDVSLAQLRHWDAAPENPMRCDSAGLKFCFSTQGLKNKDDFWKNLRKAVARGLKPSIALGALTTQPAQMLGMNNQLGAVKNGYYANLVLSDGDLFGSEAKKSEAQIYSVFVNGEEYVYTRQAEMDVRGKWTVQPEGGLAAFRLEIEGKANSPSATAKKDTIAMGTDFALSGQRVTLRVQTDTLGVKGSTRFGGTMMAESANGTAILPDGREVKWTAKRDSMYTEKPKKDDGKSNKPERALSVISPNTAFGFEAVPPQQSVLLKNATVWTAAKSGVLKETDVLIKNGKIAAIGKNLSGADVTVDATGKHITPGIIDEHSHIAIEAGVNEGTHAITAEVRIGDVLNPDDINIYRQLSGGVTSSHLLHGSANPIGGQLQLIKLRWGSDADELKFREAAGTIKFALGENVKQSHWGDNFTVRYPQTRMGVEEIMRDGFRAALEYEKKRNEAAKGGMPVKRDIQLETLLEIIKGKRFIHCHSYVQSEILMLMRLAEEFDFRVKTFTHILEGYKVAREMKEHGTTASSFSDWWAYKMEVYDAIPQNTAILNEQGVVTSVNSDDAEMARRLNQEAAKGVKYGNMSQEDAIKMCTINPAIQLGVDDLTGSIETGKQADVVLWTGNPLSSFSRVLQTYVDGRKYFDVDTDKQLRERDRSIRAQLEQRALKAIAEGESKTSGGSKGRREYHCEDTDDEVQGNDVTH